MDAVVRQRRMPPPELGPMLNRARMRAGLRGREATRLLGVAPSYPFALEAGLRCPSMTMARRLAELYALADEERAELFAAAVDDAGLDHPARSGRTGTAASG